MCMGRCYIAYCSRADIGEEMGVADLCPLPACLAGAEVLDLKTLQPALGNQAVTHHETGDDDANDTHQLDENV
jgi:hypothetical protein